MSNHAESALKNLRGYGGPAVAQVYAILELAEAVRALAEATASPPSEDDAWDEPTGSSLGPKPWAEALAALRRKSQGYGQEAPF